MVSTEQLQTWERSSSAPTAVTGSVRWSVLHSYTDSSFLLTIPCCRSPLSCRSFILTGGGVDSPMQRYNAIEAANLPLTEISVGSLYLLLIFSIGKRRSTSCF